jgi:peptidyl-prolyl cis-trans isomerase D
MRHEAALSASQALQPQKTGMLRGLRKASANWLGKLVMGTVVTILVLSFAVWGVGDIFRGFGQSTVAKLGNTEISVEQFRSIFTERLQQLSRQLGRPITQDQARSFGLDRQILQDLLAETALDEKAKQIGLGITDAAVSKRIREESAFRGASGEFDPALFQQRIRGAGYTEQRFVAEQRRLMVRRQLAEGVSAISASPAAILDAMNRFQNEQRTVEYIVLGEAQAGEIATPSAETLTQYFEERKALFRAPEYRRIIVLRLAPQDISRWIEVSDADAKRVFEERRARYASPERRHLQQIIFSSPEEAKAAADKIAGGATFEAIAQERGLSEKDIDLGFVGRSAALAPAVAEAAFALKEGEVSAPVQARVGTALVKVVKIQPEQVRPFAEVADQIKSEIVAERTRAEINDKHDKIEDERAGGATLAETAQKLGLVVNEIEAVDRSGRDPGGATIPGLDPALLSAAFSTDIGVETDATQIPGGGYQWFEVAGVTPSRERSFEEVKDRVEARWREDQIAEQLVKKSNDLLEKLKAGTPLAQVAEAEGLKVESATIERDTRSGPLPTGAIEAAFRTAPGAVGVADGESRAQRIIFRVGETTTPALDANAEDGKQLRENLRNAISQDLLVQYVAQIEKELGTSINQDALRRAVGGEAQ